MKKSQKVRKETFSNAPQWYTNKRRAKYERKKQETLAEIKFLRKITY